MVASTPVAMWIVYVSLHARHPVGTLVGSIAGLVVCAATGFLLDDAAAETVAYVPIPLVVRRASRVLVTMPLLWAIWCLVAWYGRAFTGEIAVQFAGMLALTFALAAIGGDIIGEQRAGLFATPALFFLLGASAFLSGGWSPFPLTPGAAGSLSLGGHWGIVLAASVAVFLIASMDPAARHPARKTIPGGWSRSRAIAGGWSSQRAR